MSRLPLELPTIQNWSCHSCGECCKQHGIFITAKDKTRIEQQSWTPADGIPDGQPLFVDEGGLFGTTWQRLAHQANGACVFLDEQGLCRIHARYGEAAKPLACRIYPYAFHPAGHRLTVSLRFSCPSVTRNLGRPVTAQRLELQELAGQVVPDDFRETPVPEITPGQRVSWPDFLQFTEALEGLLSAEAPVLIRLLRVLGWVGLVEQARFDKLQGQRLREFLGIITQAIETEFPGEGDVPTLPAPSRVGRMQFRLLAGQYARKDTYLSDRSLAGRWRLLRMAMALTRGTGQIPAGHQGLREVPFARLDEPAGPLPPAAEELFTRYFRVKVAGLHFCGKPYFGVPFVEGVYSLVLVYPVVLWIARWHAASCDAAALSDESLVTAFTLADHNHGYSRAFGTWGFRRRVRNLAQLGDIARLCAWYGR
jgi:lysine-N-methylase